jgi:hypothetical protein
MGLDQYAHRVKENGERTEIAYWRKHNRLQGWMESLYIKKGGTEQFNCVDVEIGWEDVIQLQEDINNHSLPHTRGDFFGIDSYGDEDKMNWNLQADLEFIDIAKLALDCNDKVVYSSWW